MYLLRLSALCALLCLTLSGLRADLPPTTSGHEALLERAAPPLLFMENRGQVRDLHGQARPDILFLARQGGVKVAVRANGISYQFEEHAPPLAATNPDLPGAALAEPREPGMVTTHRLDLDLLGANPNPTVERHSLNPYFENHYNLPGATDGIVGVRAYERIILHEVYPGIDWVIYTQDGRMKYDFVLRPGADPNLIRLRYRGAEGLRLNNDGSLTAGTPLGEITEAAPHSFTERGVVGSSFVLHADGVLTFALDQYDPTLPLTIDPALVWATYYGGSDWDQSNAVSTDPAGNVYIAGRTLSNNNISAGGHDNTYGGGYYNDAFLVKFDGNGVRLWATYYGGNQDDIGQAVCTDQTGNVYLAGYTESSSSIAAGGHQNTKGPYTDAFLVKFDTDGVRLWGTYYGGGSIDY
ncbi:MAG: SBBP repeat-containing protein, partial [Lewinella sp.]|nr:SBBP repeat-containing protein [Lewinella sp.]